MRLRILALASLVMSAPLVTAQTERITVRMAPSPNQTVRQHMTIAVAMTTDPDTLPAGAPAASEQAFGMKTTMDVTSTVGPTDGRGYYDAHVVPDNVAMTMTLNGRPMPTPPNTMEGIGGHGMIFHYDDQGRMTGVSPESPLDAATASITQAMTGVLTTVAPITLSVGESVTVPTQVNLPVPSAPPGAMSMKGETRFTLTSVSFDGADRIAHLAVKTTIVTSHGSADPSRPQMALETRTTGEGTCDVNVDRGIVLHNEQRSTVDSSARLSTPTMPDMRWHGTVTVSADFVK